MVDDQRVAAGALTVGATLDPVILDAALRLGSLRPADLGTSATRFDIRLDDEDGFTLKAEPVGWSAVFGFYTPTLRTTDLIPGQVRLLRSMLAGREDTHPARDPGRRPERHDASRAEDASPSGKPAAVTDRGADSARAGVW